jgi:predicted histidine transporter YuiF (NhaC family)
MEKLKKLLSINKTTILINIIAFVAFLIPYLFYCTVNELKVDIVAVLLPFGFGMVFEKAKRLVYKYIGNRL